VVLRKTKQAILRRAAGRCEVGGEPFRDNRIDHHHVMGRSWLGLPWSDSAEAGAAVCRAHHDHCQNNPLSAEQRALEALVVERLEKRVMAEGGQLSPLRLSTSRGEAARLVGELERLGVEP
jgi:hypothetical protein